MSRYTQGPCPNSECDSSNGYTVYHDKKDSYCFVCGYSKQNIKEKDNEMDGSNNSVQFVPTNAGGVSLGEIDGFSSYPISSRGISKEVIDHYKVKMEVNEDGAGVAHYYPYTDGNTTVGYKRRELPKSFTVVGSQGKELFGQSLFTGGKSLVITEGEMDTLAVAEAFYQKYKRFYPVVSVPSASGTKTILENREWVRSFENVVLMFDNDEAGQKALDQACKIIGIGKVKIAKLKEKDPNEELMKHGGFSLIQAFYNAQTYSPAGILVGEQIWEKYLERKHTESIPYPPCLSSLNDKIKGMRQGEITLLTSGTGSGKSTITKEIMLHLLSTTDSKVGIISLEESPGDTMEQLINMHLSTQNSTEEETRATFKELFADERIVLLDHQGSVSDASLTDKIEYMALMGCTHLFLDHITIAVSEGAEGLSGNEAVDKMMSDLLKIVKKHNIWLGLVSHLRKAMMGKAFEEGHLATIDDIKGSGSIKQISFDIIAFARNLVAEDETTKNTVKFRVLKSRFTGLTGDAGAAIYSRNTGRLTNLEGAHFEI